MIRVQDVLYLLDLDDKPIKSIKKKSDLSIEHVDDESSILTVSLSMDESVITEQQFIYRKNRYIVTEIEISKNARQQVITAEIDYLGLSDAIQTVDETTSTLKTITDATVKDTEYTIKSVSVNSDNHSIKMEGASVLSILRWLAIISELKLRFDTLNRTISYVPDIDSNIGFLFQYRKNLQDITKRQYKPKATTLIPYGKDGLTIESINNGKKYVEDFSYYESLGYTVDEARIRFNKSNNFEDGRYVYPGELMREAKKQLRTFAYPQIAYGVEIARLNRDVKIGQYGYVIDEELGIKVNVKIVRLIEYENARNNEIELNYLIPDIATTQGDTGVTDSGGIKLVSGQSKRDFSGANDYRLLIDLNITNLVATNVTGGLYFMGQVSTLALLEGYIDIDGKPIDYELKQTLVTGWHTFDLKFIILQLQEGSHNLRVFLKNDTGVFSVAKGKARIYVESANLAGGISAARPEINAVEEVVLPEGINVIDSVDIKQQKPIPIMRSEMATFPTFNVTDSVSISTDTTDTLPLRLIPQMTSNTEPAPFVADSSSNYSYTLPYRVFAHNPSDYFATAYMETTGWLSIDMGESTTVDFYRITEGTMSPINRPNTWTLEGSDDNQIWTIIDSRSGLSWSDDEMKEFILSEPVSYRYYRLNVTANNGGSNYLVIGEFALYQNR